MAQVSALASQTPSLALSLTFTGVGHALPGRAGPPGALGHPSASSQPGTLSSCLPLGDREARGGLKSAGKAPGHQVAISFIPSFTPSCSVHPTLRSSYGPRPSWSPASSCVDPALALGSQSRPKGDRALSKDMQRGEASKVLRVLSGHLSCVLTLCPRLQAGCEKAPQAVRRLGSGSCPLPPILGHLLLEGWGAVSCEVFTPLTG